MSQIVRVDASNVERVAQRIVDLLKNKSFSIASFYANVPVTKEFPRKIGPMQLLDEYIFKEGRMTILLIPNRKIFWDLAVEKVTIEFLEDGDFIIERAFPNAGTIYRVIVTSP